MLFNFFLHLINLIIKALGGVLSLVVSILPDSPFSAISSMGIDLSVINWIVPVGQILAILQAWLVAIAIYYGYMVVMRWIKII
ncbi:hypothetical protein SAMN05446037_100316 [Anaerovirgula multivorans]|uniref:Uncharacterized protein n=1 Tax=Anaerovirgula multivorans TaxID=312168 RepID=A0A239B5D1_9FIRM|nr:hypothetical protein [Anaerovirgula multivorans]SNS03080.1 hypothetical protein SAMN05446037_100316 [Anaerovirgula multivorans]